MIFLTGNQLKILRNADNKSKKDIVNEFVEGTITEQNILDIENGLEFQTEGYLDYTEYYMKHFNVSFADDHFDYLIEEIIEDLGHFGNIKVYMFFRTLDVDRLPGMEFYCIEDYSTDGLDDDDIKENFTQIDLLYLLELMKYQIRII